ncbi:MAG: S-layer homology domain-containing protein, partial [Eubacteriales bacterium]|nr:S-layer homology domain-containing protein [Eubacteriales bacterium]
LRVEGGTVGAINLKKGTNVTYTNGAILLDSGIVDDQYKTQFDIVELIPAVFADGDKGYDTNDGSPEKPVKTLWKAFDLLKDTGGTVVIKGVVTLNARTQDDKKKLTLPEHQKPIAVTSLFAGVDYRTSGAKLVLKNGTSSLNLSGDISFDNLVFHASVNNCFIAARYHNLTIGANCTTVFATGVADTVAPILLAGVNSSDTAKKAGGETIKTPFSLQIAGGVWQSVRLGDRDLTEINTIDTTATLDISGGTFTGNTRTFYAEYNTNIGVMALYQCNLSQNAVVTMNITGGTFNGPVIGFGQQHRKKQNTQAGKIVMNITGGTFARSGDEYNSVVVPAGCMLSDRVTYDSSSSVEVNIDFPQLNLQTKPLTVLADKNENGPAITVNITGVYQGDPGIKVLDSEKVTVNIPIIGEIEVTDVNRITAGTAVEESDFTYDAHGSAGAVSFRFYSDENCTDEIAAPSAIGTYWVKAYLEAAGNYSEAESEPFAFEIFASDIQEDTTQRVAVSAGGGLRVSATVEGNTISIGTIALNHLNGFGEGETLDLNLSRISKDVKTLKLSGGLLTNLSVSKLDGMTVTFPSGVVVNVDKATIKAVLAQSNGRAVQLRVRTGNVMWRTLNPAQRAKALGLSDSVDIFDASFLVGVTPISDFGGGTVTLNIPCDSRKQVRLWYLADNGAIEFVPSSYDKENGILTATLNHFSHYAIEEVAESDYKACEKGIYCPLNSYADLTAAEWYHDGIHYCLGKGLFQVSGNVFDPDSAATRARIVTALWRLEGMPGATAKSFPDVADGQYYTEAIRWASEKGIVLGYDNGNFGPDDSVTREQLAIILWRFAKYKNSDVSTAEKTDIAAYTDASLVNAQALSAMKWAVGSGLIQGTTLTTLEPQGIATNAQLATLVLRFAEAMGK